MNIDFGAVAANIDFGFVDATKLVIGIFIYFLGRGLVKKLRNIREKERYYINKKEVR